MLAQAILGPGARQTDLELLRLVDPRITASTHFPSVSGQDLLVVLGGDGTLHRFLPDLIRARLPVLVFPCGSGNDLGRALGIHSAQEAIELAREFARGGAQICEIDIGIIADDSGTETPFCCTGGVGLDAIASRFANQLPRWIRAHGGYLLAAVRALFANPVLGLKIRAGTAEGVCARDIALKSCLFSFANTPSFGGGLRIAPKAQLDDGRLDCVYVEAMSRASLAAAMISLLKGTHLQLKQVHSLCAETLHIDSDLPALVYADGEFVCETPVKVRVRRRALRVLRPA